MAGTIKTNAVQLGDSATATQNFTLRTNADGTATLARGNVGATTQDILTIGADGKLQLMQGLPALSPIVPPPTVRLNTANGYGSTNIAIRRFANIVTNTGSDITYADSATLGATFTINTAGVYAISYTDSFSTTGGMAISLNSAQLTTAPTSITVATRLALAVTSANDLPSTIAVTLPLAANDVIRAHGITSSGASTDRTGFTITRVA